MSSLGYGPFLLDPGFFLLPSTSSYFHDYSMVGEGPFKILLSVEISSFLRNLKFANWFQLLSHLVDNFQFILISSM